MCQALCLELCILYTYKMDIKMYIMFFKNFTYQAGIIKSIQQMEELKLKDIKSFALGLLSGNYGDRIQVFFNLTKFCQDLYHHQNGKSCKKQKDSKKKKTEN